MIGNHVSSFVVDEDSGSLWIPLVKKILESWTRRETLVRLFTEIVASLPLPNRAEYLGIIKVPLDFFHRLLRKIILFSS